MGIEDLIKNANDGQLALHMDDEAFNELIKACDAYRRMEEDNARKFKPGDGR